MQPRKASSACCSASRLPTSWTSRSRPPALRTRSCPGGGAVSLTVEGSDSLGHELSYEWSALCPALDSNGLFDDPTLREPSWTAPPNTRTNTAVCTLSVDISDAPFELEASSFYDHRILGDRRRSCTGSHADDHQRPEHRREPGRIGRDRPALGSGLRLSTPPDHLQMEGIVSGLADGGSFDDPSSATPQWTAPLNQTGFVRDCTLALHVDDGPGGKSDDAMLVQQVASETGPVAAVEEWYTTGRASPTTSSRTTSSGTASPRASRSTTSASAARSKIPTCRAAR